MNTMRTAVLLAIMTAVFMAVGYLIAGRSGLVVAFLIALFTNFYSYWNSDKLVLHIYGAQQVDDLTAPRLYRIVSRLARDAQLPRPRVFIIDNDQPNAFATGRNPQNAAVAATTGLLNQLSDEELSGVIAHELSHVQHRDTLTMTITATLAGAIAMLGNFALFFGGNDRDNNGNANPLGAIGVIIAMVVAPLAAMIVQMAISRSREYDADRRGGEICGNPLWLASALKKIAANADKIANEAAEQHPATAHMFIINPLTGSKMDNLFSTHPDTVNRIAALTAQAQKMGITDFAENSFTDTKNTTRPHWLNL